MGCPSTGTLRVDGRLSTGTLPMDGRLSTGTLPMDGCLSTGTLPMDGCLSTGTLPVRTPLSNTAFERRRTLFFPAYGLSVHRHATCGWPSVHRHTTRPAWARPCIHIWPHGRYPQCEVVHVFFHAPKWARCFTPKACFFTARAWFSIKPWFFKVVVFYAVVFHTQGMVLHTQGVFFHTQGVFLHTQGVGFHQTVVFQSCRVLRHGFSHPGRGSSYLGRSFPPNRGFSKWPWFFMDPLKNHDLQTVVFQRGS